jgi:hypothetical protein
MAMTVVQHKDQFLTDISLKLTFMGQYIANQTTPRKSVNFDTDRILAYDKSHLRRENTRVGPKSVTPTFEFGFADEVTYYTQAYGLKALVTRKEMRRSDKPINADKDIMEALTELLAVDREVRVATAMLNTSTFASVTKSGGSQWSAKSTSTPVDDIETAVIANRNASGILPNVIIADWEVFFRLANHPDVMAANNLVGKGPLKRETVLKVIADWLGIKPIIGSAMYNTSLTATASLSKTWANDVFIGWIHPRPTLKCQTCAMTFELKPGREVRRWDVNDPPGAHQILVREEGLDERIIDANCGYVIENVL